MAEGRGGSDARDAGMATLDALFARSPIGLAVLDTDLRVLRISTAGPTGRGLRERTSSGGRSPTRTTWWRRRRQGTSCAVY